MTNNHNKILKIVKTIRMEEGQPETETISEEWVEIEEENVEDSFEYALTKVPYSKKKVDKKSNLENVDFEDESDNEYTPSSPDRNDDDDCVTITPPPPERPRRIRYYPNHCNICKKGFLNNITWDLNKNLCIAREETMEDDILKTPQ